MVQISTPGAFCQITLTSCLVSSPCVNEALLQVGGIASFASQLLKAGKVSKSEGIKKVAYAH